MCFSCKMSLAENPPKKNTHGQLLVGQISGLRASCYKWPMCQPPPHLAASGWDRTHKNTHSCSLSDILCADALPSSASLSLMAWSQWSLISNGEKKMVSKSEQTGGWLNNTLEWVAFILSVMVLYFIPALFYSKYCTAQFGAIRKCLRHCQPTCQAVPS